VDGTGKGDAERIHTQQIYCSVEADSALRIPGQQLYLLEPCDQDETGDNGPSHANVEALPPTPADLAAAEAAEGGGLSVEGVVGAISAVVGGDASTGGEGDGKGKQKGNSPGVGGSTRWEEYARQRLVLRPPRYTMRLIDAETLATTSGNAASIFFGGVGANASCCSNITGASCIIRGSGAGQSPLRDHDAACYVQALHGLTATRALECSEL
jgi:hypothetical protein